MHFINLAVLWPWRSVKFSDLNSGGLLFVLGECYAVIELSVLWGLHEIKHCPLTFLRVFKRPIWYVAPERQASWGGFFPPSGYKKNAKPLLFNVCSRWIKLYTPKKLNNREHKRLQTTKWKPRCYLEWLLWRVALKLIHNCHIVSLNMTEIH